MTDDARRAHWEGIHARHLPETRSWFQPEPRTSLEMIGGAAEPGASVLDVGGGSSLLVDRLLERGYRVGVLDLAASALARSRARLGEGGAGVEWILGDVTEFSPTHRWDLWHDRAVFHFLTEPADRAAYRAVLERALERNGAVVIATFALTGPDRCSGLPVVRYGPGDLERELGSGYRLLESRNEAHRTPGGQVQDFVYASFRRGDGRRSA